MMFKVARLFFLIFLTLKSGSCFSQFVYLYESDNTREELLILPIGFVIPGDVRNLGKIKTPGLTSHMDYTNQMKRLAKKAIEKGANIIRITEFVYVPAKEEGMAHWEECRIHGEIYKSDSFEILKHALLEEENNSEYSELILYRPDYGHALLENFKYTVQVDTFKFEIFRNCDYKVKLKCNLIHTISVPGYDFVDSIMIVPFHKAYIRCTLQNPPNASGLNSVNVTTRGFAPKIDIIKDENIGVLEFSQMINVR